jgi:hypothetical protein
VFIDTLNRSLAGSESKDEDMAAYLAAAAKIEQRFNCLVVLVHHCGIDGTRPRGYTSLTAAVDVQIAVERIADREMMVRVELAKDMAEGAEIYSRLETVVLGTDPDGDLITTFVVLPAEAKGPKGAAADPKLCKNQQTMLSLIRAAGPSGLTTELWNEKPRELCTTRRSKDAVGGQSHDQGRISAYRRQCRQAARVAEDRASMSEKISFQDADGKRISGRFDVSQGIITVTAHDGRTITAEIEESMLIPETLARMLLLQLHQQRRLAD